MKNNRAKMVIIDAINKTKYEDVNKRSIRICYLYDMDMRSSKESFLYYAIEKHKVDLKRGDVILIDGATRKVRRAYKVIGSGKLKTIQINLFGNQKFEPLTNQDGFLNERAVHQFYYQLGK